MRKIFQARVRLHMSSMISQLLKDAADFFETNPKCYTNEWVATRNGHRCNILDPDADAWDIIGILVKLHHAHTGKREIPMWIFKRCVQAFKEANEMELRTGESALIIYMNEYADSVLDIINALRLAYNHAKADPKFDQPLDLTPPPPPIPPRKGGFVL